MSLSVGNQQLFKLNTTSRSVMFSLMYFSLFKKFLKNKKFEFL